MAVNIQQRQCAIVLVVNSFSACGVALQTVESFRLFTRPTGELGLAQAKDGSKKCSTTALYYLLGSTQRGRAELKGQMFINPAD